MPDALPAVTVPSFVKAGRSLASVSVVVPWRGVLVGVDDDVLLPRFHRDGRDLVLELARILGGLGLLLGAGSELILVVPGDLPLLGDVLGGVAHVVAHQRAPQAVLDHGVDQLHVAHLGAVAHLGRVGCLAHAFLSAGDDHVRLAELDGLEALRDGTQARAADLVHEVGGAVLGDAGGQQCLACRVHAGGRGQDLAEHNFIDIFSRDAGALQRARDGDGAQLGSGQARECSVEGSDGGAGGSGDDDFGHIRSPARWRESGRVLAPKGSENRRFRRCQMLGGI